MRAIVRWRRGVKEEWSEEKKTGFNIAGATHLKRGGIDIELYKSLFEQIISVLGDIRAKDAEANPRAVTEILSVKIDQDELVTDR